MTRAHAAAVVAAAVVQLVLVAVVGLVLGRDGTATLVLALLLAPCGVGAVVLAARRLAGWTFAVGAVLVYVALPFVAVVFFVETYRHAWLHDVVPALVGTRNVRWTALGVVLAAAVGAVPRRAAGAAGAIAAIAALVVWGFGHMHDVQVGVHETGWSVSFIGWLPVAGVIGAARRSPWLATALVGWLVLFALRGAHLDYASGGFWRALAPALPAAALLVSSLGLLAPRLPARSRLHPPARAR